MKIKNLMIPVGDYKTVGIDATFGDVATVLQESEHRDVLVVNEEGKFVGVLTMIDIILALEPNYKKLGDKDLSSDILSNRFVAEQFKEFDLWSNPLSTLCESAASIKVTDAMYTPADGEYIDVEADLEQGVHRYIVGVHQPVVVRDNGDVVGILRMSDIFDEIKSRMLACKA